MTLREGFTREQLQEQEASMIPESALPEFRTSLLGQLLFPGEPAYEETRKIHNAMVERHPAMIVRCAGVADVNPVLRTMGTTLLLTGETFKSCTQTNGRPLRETE